MVGVITLNLQKKCILVAKKGCNLQWQISYALLFFEKNFLFLDQFFLFFDLDCQNLTAFGFDNHPDLKKERIDCGKEKVSLRKELRMRALPFQCNAFPATKKIYPLSYCICFLILYFFCAYNPIFFSQFPYFLFTSLTF